MFIPSCVYEGNITMIIHLQNGECEDWESLRVCDSGRVESWEKVSVGDNECTKAAILLFCKTALEIPRHCN